ncbi:histidine phosphatase family protein [Limnoglobus roseus]|uniref:Histidine phosphatase family protein n=1 Tax=Limnoglobus roseus TaxID=2598579 RepID=A0A5C1AAC2_9BACT|nr:phosphoglycerate mutase family protein [Limnoglobus roseus]QEL15680.1 hypothetical protein PX52LOC_02615 [Limnoglobus roseus]
MPTILFVRHADIDVPPALGATNPPLNTAGQARATDLARVVGSAGVTAVFTSALTRTKQTVKPLATQLGLQPHEVPTPAELAQKMLAGALGPVVLVAGHSNTVPEMIAAFGVPSPIPPIGEREFDNLYVVTVGGPGPATVVRLKYGEASTTGA